MNATPAGTGDAKIIYYLLLLYDQANPVASLKELLLFDQAVATHAKRWVIFILFIFYLKKKIYKK